VSQVRALIMSISAGTSSPESMLTGDLHGGLDVVKESDSEGLCANVSETRQ
jgi:glutaredoxin-related protein